MLFTSFYFLPLKLRNWHIPLFEQLNLAGKVEKVCFVETVMKVSQVFVSVDVGQIWKVGPSIL